MSACIHADQFYAPTYVSECAVYTGTQSCRIQLSYASYYIPVYRDKMLITNTDKYILISLSTSLEFENEEISHKWTQGHS